MAMEKEKLLAYFQKHYISRQEVLYKLPLNISIESFWPELLKRRKASAAVLPLYNASGMPYWYVQTERMVRASEKLCEEAMKQEDDFDPYRATMTSAMTEEMFFTSFVEGAQIPLQEAMNFLQRGTEPETIQEQMIWNNRCAWAGLMGALYRPMDEQFIKSLAWTLTEEMDNAAQDYRQTDNHPIAAMGSESYVVPPAHCLPDRMRELYEFLCSGSVHPLIKASVGQAFILVTRPFPEGNERLARMISSAVLLRSGYDFFRNVSISSTIAKENYRYYKSMCEILRSENGGDLTYFVEYYLELLVKALDAKKERERRREQEKSEEKMAGQKEMLDQERRLALMPLSTVQIDEAEEDSSFEMTQEETMPLEGLAIESPPICNREAYTKRIHMIAGTCKRESVLQKLNALLSFMDKGIKRFTVADYKHATGTDGRVPYKACCYFLEKGLVTQEYTKGAYWYTLAYQDEENSSSETACLTKQSDFHQNGASELTSQALVKIAEATRSPLLPQAMAYLEQLQRNGSELFTSIMLRTGIGITSKQAYDICRMLIQKGWIEIVSTNRPRRYRLTESAPVNTDGMNADHPKTETVGNGKYDLLLKRLDKMSNGCTTDRDKRIAGFLRERVQADQLVFYRDDFLKYSPFSKSVVTSDLRYAGNLGLIERSQQRMEGTCSYEYRICAIPKPAINTERLTENQLFYLTHIFRNFGQQEFKIGNIAACLNVNPSTIGFHMKNLYDRGLLHMERRGGQPSIYRLTITPTEHPECFAECEDDTNACVSTASEKISRAEYAASAPLRSVAAAGV